MTNQTLQLLKEEFKRRTIEESLLRIETCLDLLTEEEIWRKPNANTNSVANLILHLNGNISQYILSGIGGVKDLRKREEEFTISGGLKKEELFEIISATISKANEVVAAVKSGDLSAEKNVQGFKETGLSIIIHVIEHLSYHVGQITLLTKLSKDVDTGYYKDMDLGITGDQPS